MTRRALLDDAQPGMATETTYRYHRSSDPLRDLAINILYTVTPVDPAPGGGPFSYQVYRTARGVVIADIGTASAPTQDEARDRALEMTGDDMDRRMVDPSPYWWQGAERVP